MSEPTVHDTAQVRLLADLSDAVVAHFGDAVVTRLAPSRYDWRDEVDLEIFPVNTSAPAANLVVDGVSLTLFAETDCGAYREPHRLDSTVFDWALERLIRLGESGMEQWSDTRPRKRGGVDVSRLIGDPFPEVSDSHRSRLRKSTVTTPWTDPARNLVPDPVERPTPGFFLVDDRLPDLVIEAARAVRTGFADSVSIVTRPGYDGNNQVEVLPHATDASYMLIGVDGRGRVETSTGSSQRANGEFTTISDADPIDWILAVGRHGLLEAELTRGIISWDTNGPATAEAVAAAERDRRVSIARVWKPWLPVTPTV